MPFSIPGKKRAINCDEGAAYSNQVGLFVCSIPDEPLVFVHVALMLEQASSMQSIRQETEQLVEGSQAKAAIFYSISSTQKGLSVGSAFF